MLVAAPKQLQLKARGAGVAIAAGGEGTLANEGKPCGCTGAGNCAGARGAAIGATKGLGAGNCARTGAIEASATPTVTTPIRAIVQNFTIRILC